MRLGIDLGGTAIKSGMVDDAGQVHFAETTPTNTAGGREAVLDALTAACRSQLKHEDVPSIGIGMPGFVDVENGVLVRSANLPLDGTPLRRSFPKGFISLSILKTTQTVLWQEKFTQAAAGKPTIFSWSPSAPASAAASA